MGHVLRSWQLRAVVLCASTLCFAYFAATATAATATSTSAGASCNNGLTGTTGSCTFSGSSSATLAGEFNTPAIIVDPALCGDQALDPTDTLCGHFGINTLNQQGTITVSINFDPTNDLDLCIINSAGIIVACSQGIGGTETVTFTVACGDTHYEAIIQPVSYPFPGPTALDPATYTGTVTTSLTPCVTGGNGGGNPAPPSASGGHKMTGGGQISTANISNNIIQETDGVTYKGKVRFATKDCDIRSTSIDSAEWDDANQAVIVHGHATFNGSGNVAFTVRLDDKGEPGRSDLYDMQSVCSGAGNLTNGNLQYHRP